jgi:hypothetical protein
MMINELELFSIKIAGSCYKTDRIKAYFVTYLVTFKSIDKILNWK